MDTSFIILLIIFVVLFTFLMIKISIQQKKKKNEDVETTKFRNEKEFRLLEARQKKGLLMYIITNGLPYGLFIILMVITISHFDETSNPINIKSILNFFLDYKLLLKLIVLTIIIGIIHGYFNFKKIKKRYNEMEERRKNLE